MTELTAVDAELVEVTAIPKKKSNAGRKPKQIDTDKADTFINALKIGSTPDIACAFADLSEGVVKHWLKQGALEIERAEVEAIKNASSELTFSKTQRPYALFTIEARKALAIAEVRDLKTISDASATSWQAAAWRLERMKPEKYGRRVVSHNGNVDVTHKADPNLRREAMKMVQENKKQLAQQNT